MCVCVCACAVVARCRTLSLHTTTTTNPTTDPTTHTHRRRAHTMLHPDSHTTLAPTCQEDKSHEAHLATQLEALCGVGHAGAVAAAPAGAATLPYAHTPMARMVAMVACEPAGVTSVSTIAHGCTDEDGVSTVSSSGGGTSQGCASPAKPVCVYPAVVQPRTSDSTAILVDTPTTVNMTSPQAYVVSLCIPCTTCRKTFDHTLHGLRAETHTRGMYIVHGTYGRKCRHGSSVHACGEFSCPTCRVTLHGIYAESDWVCMTRHMHDMLLHGGACMGALQTDV